MYPSQICYACYKWPVLSSISIIAEKKIKIKMADFSHFESIIWPRGRDNMKSFLIYPAQICYACC